MSESKLLQRLHDAKRSGVYRATSEHAILECTHGRDLDVVTIDARQAHFQAIAQALAFPDWFGNNWDALEDALANLPGEGHVLLLHGAPAATGDDLGILLDVLDASAGFWKSHGKPFFALAVDPARALELPSLYRES